MLSRYYFVDKIVIVGNTLFELHCSLDVLATFKSSIGSYTCFIERAASASAYDTMVTDNAITVSNAFSNMQVTTISMQNSYMPASGYYFIIPVYNSTDGITLYICKTLQAASNFFNYGTSFSLAGQTIQTSDFIWALQNAGFAFSTNDITAYMGEVMMTFYCPAANDWASAATNLAFGNTVITNMDQNDVLVFNQSYLTRTVTFTLTDPGNAYTDFRAYDPRFSEYRIYLPGSGDYVINAADAGKKDLKIDVSLDFLTMSISYRIYHDNGSDVALYSGKFGVPAPVLGTKIDLYGVLSDATTAGKQYMSYDFYGMAGTLIGTAGKVNEPQVVSKQAATGNAALIKDFPDILYYVKNYASKDIPTTVAGRPVYKNLQISSCSGYVKCGNASLQMTGGSIEKEMVNNFLNSGIYYE